MEEYINSEIQSLDSTALTVVPEREVELTKVKLDKFYNLYAEYTLRENGISSEITRKVHQPAHEDLVKAFQKLTVHLCLMTEVVAGIKSGEDEYLSYERLMPAFQSEDIYSAPEFDAYRCTGFTLTSGGVVLVGQKKLRSKKVLNIVSPFEVLEPELPTGDEYYYLADLDFDLSKALEEVKAYLEGKYSDEGRQMDLFEEVGPGSPATRALSKEVDKFVGFMDELAQDKGLKITVSTPGNANVRTFGGKELDSE